MRPRKKTPELAAQVNYVLESVKAFDMAPRRRGFFRLNRVSNASGENGEVKQIEAFKFLGAVYQKCDRLIAVKGSLFEQKAFGLWKKQDIRSYRIAKFYKTHFWYNSTKCVLLESAELQELGTTLLDGIKPDDRYLVQAYLTAGAAAIVTTDAPLKALLDAHSIRCELCDEFLNWYLQGNRTS